LSLDETLLLELRLDTVTIMMKTQFPAGKYSFVLR